MRERIPAGGRFNGKAREQALHIFHNLFDDRPDRKRPFWCFHLFFGARSALDQAVNGPKSAVTEGSEKRPTAGLLDVLARALRLPSLFDTGYWLATAGSRGHGRHEHPPADAHRRWGVRWARAMTLAALALAGCAGVEYKLPGPNQFGIQKHVHTPPEVSAALATAPDCCASLADLPYQELRTGGHLDLTLGPDSPAHQFDTGKSYFAAFRIAGLPRPTRLVLDSYPSGGLAAVSTLVPSAGSRVLQPSVLLLDPAFRVVRRIDADLPLSGCGEPGGTYAFRLPVLLTEPPAEVAYLVVLTTANALARKGQRVCGAVYQGMSPVGTLQLQVRTLPADDVPRFLLPVLWYADTPAPGEIRFFQGSDAGLLIVGERGLQVLVPDAARYRPVERIPYERITHLSTAKDYKFTHRFGISVVEPSNAGGPRRVRHHSFDRVGQQEERLLTPLFARDWPQEEGLPSPWEELERFVKARIAPAGATLVLAWSVSPQPPEILVDGGQGSKIGQYAMTGGIVTAFPCGICQAGVCPPQAIVPCAALFGIGAGLGGAAGIVGAVVESIETKGTPDSAATMQLLTQGEPVLAPGRLRQCLAELLQRQRGAPKQDGGLVARSVLVGTPAAESATPDYLVEASLRQLVLARDPKAKGGTGEAPWRLRIAGQVQLTEQATGSRKTKGVQWDSEPHPVAEWTAPESRRLAQVAAAGCAAFAERLLEAAQQAVRGQ